MGTHNHRVIHAQVFHQKTDGVVDIGLNAMRHNPDLKAKYQALIKAGKPPKVALTALMRKLIELANALIKADRNWVKRGA
jgi:transposase